MLFTRKWPLTSWGWFQPDRHWTPVPTQSSLNLDNSVITGAVCKGQRSVSMEQSVSCNMRTFTNWDSACNSRANATKLLSYAYTPWLVRSVTAPSVLSVTLTLSHSLHPLCVCLYWWNGAVMRGDRDWMLWDLISADYAICTSICKPFMWLVGNYILFDSINVITVIIAKVLYYISINNSNFNFIKHNFQSPADAITNSGQIGSNCNTWGWNEVTLFICFFSSFRSNRCISRWPCNLHAISLHLHRSNCSITFENLFVTWFRLLLPHKTSFRITSILQGNRLSSLPRLFSAVFAYFCW
jgi:hypothetical protein